MSTHRTLLIAADGGIERADDALYELNLGSTAPEAVVAELDLLAAAMADSVTLRHRAGGIRVKISRGDVVGRAIAERTADRLTLTLSDTELGYWLLYFLRYYRDGVADVNHIDLEAASNAPSGGVVDVRVRVARAVPPVSPEEARRRLGG